MAASLPFTVPGYGNRRRKPTVLTAVLLLTIYLFFYNNLLIGPLLSGPEQARPVQDDIDTLPLQKAYLPPDQLPLPPEYAHTDKDSEWCENRYSTTYLHSIRNSQRAYCAPENSTSQINCFYAEIKPDRSDPFCLMNGVTINHVPEGNRFHLDCSEPDNRESGLYGRLDELVWLPVYMYDTGPGYTLPGYFDIGPRPRNETGCISGSFDPSKYTVMIKREGDVNPWHTLNEIFSFYLTMDVLMMTPANSQATSRQTLFSPSDISSTQIVFLDDKPEGPFFELWTLFAGERPSRLKDLSESELSCLPNVILPLAGGSNPLWQGDWESGDCSHSQLLDVFVRRILDHLDIKVLPDAPGIPSPSPSSAPPLSASLTTTPRRPLTLTWIERGGTRVFLNSTTHLGNIRRLIPDVTVQAIKLHTLSLREQIQIIRNTDILVGVHGAGLAHNMFLPRDSTVIEILPQENNYKLYRNLAKLRGHRYFSAHAEPSDETREKSSDWHDWDLVMSEEAFLELVETGVKSMYNHGKLNLDIV